jgi:hypothetical protein
MVKNEKVKKYFVLHRSHPRARAFLKYWAFEAGVGAFLKTHAFSLGPLILGMAQLYGVTLHIIS